MKEDIDRLHDDDADFDSDEGSPTRPLRRRASGGARLGRSASVGRATSGASDSEDEDGEDDDVEQRKKGAFAKVFGDPREYDAATRAGRKVSGRKGSKASLGLGGSGGRKRAVSDASETGDLLGLEEEAEDGAEAEPEDSPGATVLPLPSTARDTPSRPRVARPSASRRALSKMGQSILSTTGGEETSGGAGGGGGGNWEGMSDWQIDTRIMLKRKAAGLFTVRLVFLSLSAGLPSHVSSRSPSRSSSSTST